MARSAYLNEAAALLKEARGHLDRAPRPGTPQEHAAAAWAHMWLAAQYTQIAAIEAGLAPPPLPASVRDGAGQR